MEKKNMEIDESLLDDEDGDDITISGRESISSLFIRACGIGPEDVFEDQRCASTPSSTAHTPLAQSGFPHAYYLARAARRNWMQSVSLGGVGPFARKTGTGEGGVGYGSFEVKGDCRQLEVQNFHRLSDKLNVSLSVNPRDMVCIGCPEQHAFILPDSAGIPVCLNLSDQSFSPYIPAVMGKRCIGCVRVEDAKLPDLERIFREVFRAHTGDAGHLPRGSLVMVGSYSHLATSGLAAYTEELTRIIRSISHLVGGGDSHPFCHAAAGGGGGTAWGQTAF